MLKGSQAQGKKEWVNLNRAVKGSIRMELLSSQKWGSLINKGGTAKFTKTRLGSLRRVRLAHR